MSRWREYKKALVAGGGGMILAGMAALDATGVLTAYPWASAGVATITAMGVYQVRNAQSPTPIDPLDPTLVPGGETTPRDIPTR